MTGLVSWLNLGRRLHRFSYAPPEPPLLGEEPPDFSDFEDGPLAQIPKSRREVYEVFGHPGVGKVDKAWRRENVREFHGKRAIPGIPRRFYFQIHKLAEPHLREALRRVALVEPDYTIDRAGCFNFRHMRHDPSRPLSYHAWAIAVDIDPKLNGIKRYKRGKKPELWGGEWMETWPKGFSENFVKAFESVGWFWGGRWQTFVDPMHWQLKVG